MLECMCVHRCRRGTWVRCWDGFLRAEGDKSRVGWSRETAELRENGEPVLEGHDFDRGDKRVLDLLEGQELLFYTEPLHSPSFIFPAV